jgi:hypothetical protein
MMTRTILSSVLGCILLAGCGKSKSSSVNAVEVRAAPQSGAEELVKRFILNNAKDEKVVEFVSWGPHLTDADFAALLDEAGADKAKEKPWAGMRPASFIRVCYKNPKEEGFIDKPTEKSAAAANLPKKKADSEPRGGFPQKPVWTGDGPGSIVGIPIRPEVFDRIFLASAKHVVLVGETDGGDKWKAVMRKKLAKRFPALKP